MTAFAVMTRAVLIGAALCVSARAEVAAITSQNAGMLTLLDTDDLSVRASVPLPGKPAAVAVDGPRGRVLAIAVETARLHVFDLRGAAIANWPVDGAPFGVAVRPGTGTALITDWNGFLREVDPDTGRELRHWTVGATPAGVATAGELIVTADRDADAISLIRGGTVRTVPVGHHPFGVTLHQGRAFVTDVLSDQVSVVDTSLEKVIATIPTGERPYAVAFSAGRGFVSNQYGASVTVFDAATFRVIGQIETDEYPEGIAAASNGLLFVANWFSDTVQVIDPVSLTIGETLDVPEGPRAFGEFIARP